jgi:diguanylate cyclase (GGDEF)-like protein
MPRPTRSPRRDPRLRLRRLVLQSVAGTVALAVLLAGAFASLLHATTKQEAARRWAVHTRQVLVTSGALERSLLGMESGLRGFALTHRRDFLAPYTEAVHAYRAQSRQLVALTDPRTDQGQRARAIALGMRSYAEDYGARATGPDSAAVSSGVHAVWAMRQVAFLRGEFEVFDRMQTRQLATRSGRLESGVHRVRTMAIATAAAAIGGLLVMLAVFLLGVVVPLRRAAETDPLTGALNRRSWDGELARAVGLARLTGEPLAVAIVDLDHFKTYNDTHGHAAGDEVLVEAVAAWSAILRGGDVLARYGGEEFAVALPGCDRGAATTVLQRLRMHTPRGQTASVGVAQFNGREDAAALLRRADDALYEAKAAGRDLLRHAPLTPAGPAAPLRPTPAVVPGSR